jgi:hypothetical protein
MASRNKIAASEAPSLDPASPGAIERPRSAVEDRSREPE